MAYGQAMVVMKERGWICRHLARHVSFSFRDRSDDESKPRLRPSSLQ
jgi:hypothetical protein